MSLSKSLLLLALATGLLLLIPLVAMQFTREVNWTFSDFVFAGVLLFGTGLTYLLIARRWTSTAYKLGVGAGVLAGLLLVWANAAVGLVGSEDNPVNLLYGGVLLVAFVGAIVARFRPRGMANAMFAASLTYVAVTVLGLFVWKPTGVAAEPAVHLATVAAFNAFFAFIWAVSGWLFRLADAAGSTPNRQLA